MDRSLLQENGRPRWEGYAVAGRQGLFPDGTVPASPHRQEVSFSNSSLLLETAGSRRRSGVRPAGLVPRRGKLPSGREAAGRGGIPAFCLPVLKPRAWRWRPRRPPSCPTPPAPQSGSGKPRGAAQGAGRGQGRGAQATPTRAFKGADPPRPCFPTPRALLRTWPVAFSPRCVVLFLTRNACLGRWKQVWGLWEDRVPCRRGAV